MVPNTLSLSLVTVNLGTALAKGHVSARMLSVVVLFVNSALLPQFFVLLRHPVMYCVHWMLVTATAYSNFEVKMKTWQLLKMTSRDVRAIQ
jgi:hypothetical protein